MALPEDLEFCQILVKLMPHALKTKDAIQIMVEELKGGSVINWGIIRALLKELNPYEFPRIFYQRCHASVSISQKNFEKFIFSVLILFDIHKCSDKSIIADVLEILCLTRYQRYSEYEYQYWRKIKFSGNNSRTSMSMFEKTLVFSYKDISSIFPSNSRSIHQCWNWVESLVANGEADILQVIISYGVTLIVPKEVKFNMFDYTKFVMFIRQLLLKNKEIETRNEFDSLLHHVVQNASSFDENFIRRLYFVNKILMIFIKFDFHTRTDAYIQCARIFMKSTPEPLVTSDEIKIILTKFCRGIIPNEKVLQFVEEYESHFPESREASAPRSLKHLSRFHVRESLRTAKTFPYGVKHLCIPKKIQDYICLKDIL